jgi:hypothetical protein
VQRAVDRPGGDRQFGGDLLAAPPAGSKIGNPLFGRRQPQTGAVESNDCSISAQRCEIGLS